MEKDRRKKYVYHIESAHIQFVIELIIVPTGLYTSTVTLIFGFDSIIAKNEPIKNKCGEKSCIKCSRIDFIQP